ncbi:MAG: response regulator [Phycisphaerales bacterium]|nr:response regulator [Phycisphaerales bacterium]
MDARTILLADDEAHITCVVAGKLRASGFQVVVARDGEEALDLARQSVPQLVITDLQMPRMSGLELALQLRMDAATAAIPVIMLSARGYIADPESMARTNIKLVMSKPFSAKEVVRNALDVLGLSETAAAPEAAREAA